MGTFGAYRKHSTNTRIASLLEEEGRPMTASEITGILGRGVSRFNIYAAYKQGQISRITTANSREAKFLYRRFPAWRLPNRPPEEHNCDMIAFSTFAAGAILGAVFALAFFR